MSLVITTEQKAIIDKLKTISKEPKHNTGIDHIMIRENCREGKERECNKN